MAADQPPEGDHQILAFDVGQRRIGVARAQSRARLVEPLEIVEAGGGEFVRIKELLEAWRPKVIVIGLPLDKRGLAGHQAGIIRAWTEKMVARTGFGGQVVYWDETLSSRAAGRRAGSAPIDDLAAGILLEDYLN